MAFGWGSGGSVGGLDLDVQCPLSSPISSEHGGGGSLCPTRCVTVIEADSLPYNFHPEQEGKLKSIWPMMRQRSRAGEGGEGSWVLTDGWLKGADQLS